MAIKALESKVLGKFVYDEEYEWYSTKYIDREHIFEIRIFLEEPDEINEFELNVLLYKIERLIENKYYDTALHDIGETMTTLKNKEWLKDDEPEMLVDEFYKRVTIESIVFYDDVTSDIDCDDDDIFDGHFFVINTNENGTFEKFTIIR